MKSDPTGAITNPQTLNASPPSLSGQKGLAFFWMSRVLSSMANQIQAVAVAWQIYALTGSAFYLGLVGLAQFLPMFLLSLVVGHVADHYDRRLIAGVCQVVQWLAGGTLAVLSYTGWQTKESLLITVFIVGAARAFEGPTMSAMVPGLVPPFLLPRAIAAVTSATKTATTLGPALGGLLFVVGPTIGYGTASVLFLAAATFVMLVRVERAASKREPVTLRSLFAGIAYIRSRQTILGAISLDLFAVLLGGATALLPVYARDILKTGPWGLGLLRSAPAAGALVTAMFLARHPIERRVGRIMFGSVVIFGLCTIVFGLSRSLVLSLGALAALGAADVVSVVIRSSLIQIETPDAMRGRVNAVNSMFTGTSNQLGEFESGVTAALFGTVPAVLIGGAGTIAVVILWMRLFPQLVHVESL